MQLVWVSEPKGCLGCIILKNCIKPSVNFMVTFKSYIMQDPQMTILQLMNLETDPFLELLMCKLGLGAASSQKVDKNRMFLEFEFSRSPFYKNTIFLTSYFHSNGPGGCLRGPRGTVL